jgi:hypothetical protein
VTVDEPATGFFPPAELRRKHGLAVFGGVFGTQAWVKQYDAAERTLLQHADAQGALDDFVLPIVYLQRHVVELLLKTVIDTAAGIAEAQEALDVHAGVVPAPLLAEAPSTHDLDELLRVAERNARACGVTRGIGESTREMCYQLAHLEDGQPSRLRYAKVRPRKNDEATLSFPKPYSLGVRSLHELYVKVFNELWGDVADDQAPASVLDELSDVADELVQRLRAVGLF